ncbi:Uncharacterised protein [Mycobacterium tuberculosis]|uniref:Uncharacterized protein n=1 Tax=Mycobacterium tuberculosis TaxID=1773 RepID=A0A0T9FDH8_MYCTX|nr:Uncharacterised protein [Mycobacterium tuberculosis]CKU11689.1 Uncharacterised protein [Mycobacterium tuberculosis]COW81278.1 Uncharacterised protein [Mycobacterium tuberculosis]
MIAILRLDKLKFRSLKTSSGISGSRAFRACQ